MQDASNPEPQEDPANKNNIKLNQPSIPQVPEQHNNIQQMEMNQPGQQQIDFGYFLEQKINLMRTQKQLLTKELSVNSMKQINLQAFGEIIDAF